MAIIEIVCAQCGALFNRERGLANRSNRLGMAMHCGRVCSAINRRKEKSVGEKRAEKAAYDKKRRLELATKIKSEKAAYYQRTKDPVREAAIRKKRMPKHVEYCRRPEYVEWKRGYDKVYRAKTEHGEFWEAALLALEIRKACLELTDDTEIRRQKGTLNKHQTRRRDYDRTHSNKPEIGALGNFAGA